MKTQKRAFAKLIVKPLGGRVFNALLALFMILYALIDATRAPVQSSLRSFSFSLPHFDKIVHYFGYGFLTLFLMKSLHWKKGNSFWTQLFIVVCSVNVLGAVNEYIQYAQGLGRNADIYDLIANFLGSLSYALLFVWAYHIFIKS